MTSYLAAIAIILVLMVVWVAVQYLAEKTAAGDPEQAPYGEYRRGCGTCGCGKRSGPDQPDGG
jgi:hypothetical protein